MIGRMVATVSSGTNVGWRIALATMMRTIPMASRVTNRAAPPGSIRRHAMWSQTP